MDEDEPPDDSDGAATDDSPVLTLLFPAHGARLWPIKADVAQVWAASEIVSLGL
jgi:hypothetical protein